MNPKFKPGDFIQNAYSGIILKVLKINIPDTFMSIPSYEVEYMNYKEELIKNGYSVFIHTLPIAHVDTYFKLHNTYMFYNQLKELK